MADIKIRLNSWPHRSGIYRGNEELYGLGEPWPVGETRTVGPQAAAYLLGTFPEQFVKASGGTVPALAKTAGDWAKAKTSEVLAAIKGGSVDGLIFEMVRAEKGRSKPRPGVLSALRNRSAVLMDDEDSE